MAAIMRNKTANPTKMSLHGPAKILTMAENVKLTEFTVNYRITVKYHKHFEPVDETCKITAEYNKNQLTGRERWKRQTENGGESQLITRPMIKF